MSKGSKGSKGSNGSKGSKGSKGSNGSKGSKSEPSYDLHRTNAIFLLVLFEGIPLSCVGDPSEVWTPQKLQLQMRKMNQQDWQLRWGKKGI